VGGTFTAPDKIAVGLGESATCTITNDDDAPSLTLVKVVDNGLGQVSTAVATDWILSAAGPTGFSGQTGVTSGPSFDQGTYNLTESGPSGYLPSDWVCVGGSQDDGDTITVGLGEDATCTITNTAMGKAKIIKLTQSLPNDNTNPATQEWRFTLQDCGDDGCLKTDPIIGDVTSPPSEVPFGAFLVPVQYDPNQTYRLCEVMIPVGWTNTWKGDANDDGTPETAISFVPSVNDAPVVDPPGWSNVFDPQYAPPPEIFSNDERCVNFVVDTGATEVFEINNMFPGGEPRTIGYWKNWNSCTGGNQVLTAIKNGGETPTERLGSGNALLDDVLQSPGIKIGELTLIANDDVFDCDEGTQDALNILDKREITGKYKKKANDAAYSLAAQLLAAIANEAAGAGVCTEAGQAIVDAQQLLVDIGFDGTGNYLRPKHPRYTEALNLASTLDSYNNGTLCTTP
jgi:hypothetical protein